MYVIAAISFCWHIYFILVILYKQILFTHGWGIICAFWDASVWLSKFIMRQRFRKSRTNIRVKLWASPASCYIQRGDISWETVTPHRIKCWLLKIIIDKSRFYQLILICRMSYCISSTYVYWTYFIIQKQFWSAFSDFVMSFNAIIQQNWKVFHKH